MALMGTAFAFCWDDPDDGEATWQGVSFAGSPIHVRETQQGFSFATHDYLLENGLVKVDTSRAGLGNETVTTFERSKDGRLLRLVVQDSFTGLTKTDPTGTSRVVHQFKYNDAQLLTEVSSVLIEGRSNTWCTYKNGEITQTKISQRDLNSPALTLFRSKAIFDAQKRLIEVVEYYNQKGDIESLLLSSPLGTPYSRTKFVYSPSGQLQKREEWVNWIDGEILESTTSYFYNSQGFLVKSRYEISEDDASDSYENIFTVDGFGNWTKLHRQSLNRLKEPLRDIDIVRDITYSINK